MVRSPPGDDFVGSPTFSVTPLPPIGTSIECPPPQPASARQGGYISGQKGVGFYTGSLMADDMVTDTEKEEILKEKERSRSRRGSNLQFSGFSNKRRESLMLDPFEGFSHRRRKSSVFSNFQQHRRRSSGFGKRHSNPTHDTAQSLFAPKPIDYSDEAQPSEPAGDGEYSSKRNVTPELESIWSLIDIHDKGYLNFEEVEYLLDDLGVEMDDWKETEFLHKVDADQDGRVTLDEFSDVYAEFRDSGKFTKCWSCIHLAVSVAVKNGVLDTNTVVRVWQRYDINGDECLDFSETSKMLQELGLPATEERVREFMQEMDLDNSGYIEFDEFVFLFTPSAYWQDENKVAESRLTAILSEVRNTTATASYKASSQFRTETQLYVDMANKRLSRYSKYYSILLFLYAQLNILIPTFLVFVEPVSFEDYDNQWLSGILLLSDLVYIWYIVAKLSLPRQDELGVQITEPSAVRRLYFRQEFPLDVFIIFPFELLAGVWFQAAFLHPLFRLNKLLLLSNINNLFSQCFSEYLGPIWWRIANALYWWGMIAHAVACLFFVVAREAGDDDTRIMLTVANYSKLSHTSQYLQAYSYAVNTMAGLSRGTFPKGDLQHAFALMTVLLGVWVYALMLAVVSMALSAKTQSSRFAQYLDDVKDVLQSEIQAHRLPSSFAEEALAYHRHVFATTGCINLNDDILEDVPTQLGVALSLVGGSNTIGSVPIFAGASPDFIYCLQQCLTASVVPPDYDIIKQGEVGHVMYFITHGTCEILSGNLPVHELSAGSFFGEISLLASCPRTATIRSKTYCNLLVLTQDDFYAVMTVFPETMELIEIRAKDRIRDMMLLERENQRHALLGDRLGKAAVSAAKVVLTGDGNEVERDELCSETTYTDVELMNTDEIRWIASRTPAQEDLDISSKDQGNGSPGNPLRSRRSKTRKTPTTDRILPSSLKNSTRKGPTTSITLPPSPHELANRTQMEK
eukprot:TRINITY_DN15991_c0_g1_i1.p1 TRINITY_DN15991_c0_g1~~TRINITY_DN15991_c0_g1_i1.p1  ORF type:complete len:969 (+),score=161.06 TRINITY_DN15991_c0_g1_i1:52-2958(+)